MTIEELMCAAEGKKIKIYPNEACIRMIQKNTDGSYTIHAENYTELFPDDYGCFSFCDAKLHMEATLIKAQEKTNISHRTNLLERQKAEENRKKNQEKEQVKAAEEEEEEEMLEQQRLQKQQELLEKIKQKLERLEELTELQGTDSDGMPFVNMIFDYPSCKIGETIVFVRDTDNEAFRPAIFTGFEKMGGSSFIWAYDGIDNSRRGKDSTLVNLKQEFHMPNLDPLINSYQKCYSDGYFSNGKYAEKIHNASTDRNEIYNYLVNERSVTSLIHFTKLSNLPSIFEYGILPIETIREYNIASCSDTERSDGRLDCSCFTISYPNYSMFSSKWDPWHPDNPDYYAYAILEIDIAALISKNVDEAYFMPINAADRLIKQRGIDSFNHLADAKNMFCESIVYNDDEILRDNLHIPNNYTTCPQAELMIAGWIDPKHIKRIDVNSPETQQKLLKNNFVQANSIDITFKELFNSRLDYQNWKTKGRNF